MEYKLKLLIGFLTYGDLTAKYLPDFLVSLKNQTYQNFEIVVLDNTLDRNNKNYQFISDKYPQIKIIWSGQNFGFSKAYNKLIQSAIDLGAEYFLVLNPDTILEPNAIEKMIKVLDSNYEYGSVSPKVLKLNAENKIIDTLGIKLSAGLHFYDLGQSEMDNGQFDQTKILGPSGCAGMYRLKALQEVGMKIDGQQNIEYFDELMFMYKEDCDLAYRLQLAGWKSALVPTAIIYHDRTADSLGNSYLKIILNRNNKNKQIKKWSFRGQQILFKKYFYLQSFWNKIKVIIYQFEILFWVFLFEPYLLSELKNIKKKKKEINLKRKSIKLIKT